MIVVFNEQWQADENTQVMVSNRGGKDSQIFCRAGDVQIRDNVWEHNIVQTIRKTDKFVDGLKVHYGPVHKD
jgi:hypothetical protein